MMVLTGILNSVTPVALDQKKTRSFLDSILESPGEGPLQLYVSKGSAGYSAVQPEQIATA